MSAAPRLLVVRQVDTGHGAETAQAPGAGGRLKSVHYLRQAPFGLAHEEGVEEGRQRQRVGRPRATAQHDRVVASYSLLAAVGKLNAETLGLKVATYDPVAHYQAVRDKWGGLRTPDGR